MTTTIYRQPASAPYEWRVVQEIDHLTVGNNGFSTFEKAWLFAMGSPFPAECAPEPLMPRDWHPKAAA